MDNFITTQPNLEKLLNRKEAADFLGVTEHTLAVWACNKRYNLPYVKVGRLVKYRYADLLVFIERNTEKSENNHA